MWCVIDLTNYYLSVCLSIYFDIQRKSSINKQSSMIRQ